MPHKPVWANAPVCKHCDVVDRATRLRGKFHQTEAQRASQRPEDHANRPTVLSTAF